ncbi:Type 1 glutamine amidotransferase-like domain-containing protein [Patulibacter defluvii]|uniref:Type 1 glutamine amidotransferase-like domain-containing protein n=1 Tax=Patulibacter defluvii TaxID=3095358 RepID=UPI002A76631B|nr:Type 1 glutamine amidotransferase-like domain-containing protein [Patulibacter sp. DM4]
MRCFLIGGGRDPEGVAASHAPFAAAAGGPDATVVAYLLDEGAETDPDRWRVALTGAGAGAVRTVVLSPSRPPAAADLDGASGVFVAGGETPGYQQRFAVADGWVAALRERGLPYAGFSAGAAIAATAAIVGGWRDGAVAVCDPDVGEGLEPLTVRPGLGLLPGAVDVHCAQWGTLPRLLAALRRRPGTVGWGIDEHTTLERDGDRVRVHGLGAVHRATAAADGRATVAALTAGDTAALS